MGEDEDTDQSKTIALPERWATDTPRARPVHLTRREYALLTRVLRRQEAIDTCLERRRQLVRDTQQAVVVSVGVAVVASVLGAVWWYGKAIFLALLAAIQDVQPPPK